MPYRFTKAFCFMLTLASCTGSAPNADSVSTSGATKTSATGATKKKKKNLGAPTLDEQALPSDTDTTTEPSPSGKALKVQRVGFFRAVYLDLTRKDWSTYDSAEFVFNAVGSVARFEKLQATDPTPETLNSMSIYQPLLDSATTSTTGLEKFHSIGFTAVAGTDSPTAPTVIATPLADPEALAPPDDYELIFQIPGPSDEDLSKQCEPVFMGKSHKQDLLIFCQEYFGTAGANQGYGINLSGGPITDSGWFQKYRDLLDKKALFVWRAKPPKGYRCLGTVTTNTSAKPDSREAGSSNGQAANQADIESYQNVMSVFGSETANVLTSLGDPAIWCVKETYLTEGRFGPKIFNSGALKVGFYKVVPKDPSAGLADSGLFVALAEKTIQGTTQTIANQAAAMEANHELWVLKKDAIEMLPDVLKNGPNN